MKKCIVYLFLGCFFSEYCNAQTRAINNISQKIYAAKAEGQLLEAILQLCEESQSLDRDTLDYYAIQAEVLAKKIGSKQQNDLAAIARANAYSRWGWTDSALEKINPVISSNDVNKVKEREIFFKAMRQKALYYGTTGKYPEALELFYKIVSQAEKCKDTLAQAVNLNSIGSIGLINETPQKTLPVFRQALSSLSTEKKYNAAKAAIYVNMGEGFRLMQRYDSALYYNSLGMQLFKTDENLSSLGITLQRRSNIYIDQKQYLKAEEIIKELIVLRKSMGDDKRFVDDNTTLIDFYLATKQEDKAIAYCKGLLVTGSLYADNGNQPALYLNQLSFRLQVLEALAKSYKQKNDQAQYAHTLESILSVKDSINLLRQDEGIAEIKTKYEVQKKENLIMQQNYDLQKKSFFIYGTIALSLVILIASIGLFRIHRKRNRLKMKVALDEEKRNAHEAIKDAEEQERKRIAADLHDNIGAYASAIRADVEKITESGPKPNLSSLKNLEQHSQEIINSLRDTIWVLNKDNITITAISDRIKNYVGKLLPSYPSFQIQIKEQIDNDIKVSSKNALNMFRIVQEAVHNALKHSAAQNISIAIISNDKLVIQVSDDGKGLGAKHSVSGNGLGNMKSRAAAMDMEMAVVANPGEGTTVILQSNTTN